tara:strand:- start:2642 stop:2842 length:201 start_codon:yes stop_codon:yes gene_type:complete
MKKEFYLLTLAIIVIAGLNYSGKLEQQDAEIASAEYASMVCLGRETSQQFGWPNYLNLEINCTEIN